MEIIIELNGYCIETAVKKRYEYLVSRLLKMNDENLEQELEFLLEFLKKSDFSKLRMMGFDGRKKMKVKIFKKSEGFEVVEI